MSGRQWLGTCALLVFLAGAAGAAPARPRTPPSPPKRQHPRKLTERERRLEAERRHKEAQASEDRRILSTLRRPDRGGALIIKRP
jgi:hypothetical protein